MGAVTFSLDTKLIGAIKKALPLAVFVETGTFKGDTVASCLDEFDEFHSIELSEELYLEAEKRFANERKVALYHDDSAHRLTQLQPLLQNKSALYWLDAHWCVADDSAGEKSQCPLLDEISALGSLNCQSVVVIDDARLFLCPPPAPHEILQWPSFHNVIEKLFATSQDHRIAVVNDCIIYYPKQIEAQITEYAKLTGIDWLRIMDIYNDKASLKEVLEEKEYEISQLSVSAQDFQAALQIKDQAIQEKEAAIHEKERAIDELTASGQHLHTDLQLKDLAIQEKEQAINQLNGSAQDLHAALELKDQAIQEKEAAIHEKEQAINQLGGSAKDLHAALQLKDQAIQEKEAAIHEKEQAINQLSASAQDLLVALQLKDQVIQEDEATIQEKIASLSANQMEIAHLKKTINQLSDVLEAKENCIQAQDQFIKQHHFLRFYCLKICLNCVNYALFKFKSSRIYRGIVFIHTKIQEIVTFLYRSCKAQSHKLASAQKVKFKRKFGPFLGVLNQYPPKELILPKSYYTKAAIIRPLKISIVTPSFKQANFIERTIKSVINQQYPNLEYFVQDGGSKDGTVAILQKYTSELTDWESSPDRGQSHAINLGFQKTTGEIMAWLNSDDLLLPGTLNYVSNYFAKHPDVDVIYGNRIIIDENDLEIGRWVMPRNDYAVLSWADYVPQETLFWRRNIWEKAGGRIDESFQFAMDWDLLVRFRDAGACINRLPRFLGAFRVHTQQKTSAVIAELGHKEMQIIRKRCNGFEPSAMETADNIRHYLNWNIIEQNFKLIHYKR